MAPKDGNVGREMGEGYKYVSLGLTFAGGIVVFLFAGIRARSVAGYDSDLHSYRDISGHGAELSHCLPQARGRGAAKAGTEG